MTRIAHDAILRSLCFHEAWGYAPTYAELVSTVDIGFYPANVSTSHIPSHEEVMGALDIFLYDETVQKRFGRIGFPDTIDGIVSRIRDRDSLQPRKRRRARFVAWWLAHLGSVRFVALANTTALSNARDGSDLDFFIITKSGAIWMTRFLGGVPLRLLRWTPAPEQKRDAVCLSYFISDLGLNLSSHLLRPDDPYFRYWFLSLLPLYDDGILSDFWAANIDVRRRHPFAQPWIISSDLRIPVPVFRFPTFVGRLFEPIARIFQMRWFPLSIQKRMNIDTTVIVNNVALKFHTTDHRAEYRQMYEKLCRKRGVTP